MDGVIEKLHGTFGFIRGDDKVGYFFIPSCIDIRQLIPFDELRVGQRVTFSPVLTAPKGPRAEGVQVHDDNIVVDLPDAEA